MRKFFIAILAALLLSTASVFAFSDVGDNSQFFEAIEYVENEGIVHGYPDGTYKPLQEINRAEFTKIVMEAADGNIAGSNCFPDVKNEWFAAYVCGALESGIIHGYADGYFRPADTINLAEALKIIILAFDIDYEETGGAWYEPFLQKAIDENYLTNVEESPAHKLSRGEMAQIIFNIASPAGDDTGPGDDTADDDTGDDTTDDDGGTTPTGGNQYSWDGSWSPAVSDFPMSGLLDNEYFDQRLFDNKPTPILPPGQWDWNDANNDFANYRNFESSIGTFEKLLDSAGHHYGWELIGNNPDAVDYSGPAAYFEGSSGTDILNLGKDGWIHSFTNGNLGDGPDVLVFDKSGTLDFRTGSSLSGSKHDNDLVIAGCTVNTDSATEIDTTTIHTGPGTDTIFARDMERAAIDAGNGEGGKTSIIDNSDGDDVAVFKGNMADFRFFGGNGDDTAYWYVDEVIQKSLWLYPNFFGGGGSDEAIWGDSGTDRFILVIPTNTELINQTPTNEGQLMVRIDYNYPEEIEWDDPVYNDLYARYCIRCGESAEGEKTLTMEYKSADGSVNTGYFYVTDFEELQIGIGDDAKVYQLDDINGEVVFDAGLSPSDAPESFAEYCQ